jgi:decaprenylphospho-beta-D-erythro-pentofuranosid-2-ulose 2-reductase
MENAFGQPQTILVLGGTSDIARALTVELCRGRTRTVVLAGRNQDLLDEAAAEARDAGARTTSTVTFDALNLDGVAGTIDLAFERAGGPVDLVVMAVGRLGDQLIDERDTALAAQMSTVNYTWPVVALTAVREHLVAQGSGRILVMSSVAAIRVRRQNYLYAGAKAGLDRLAEAMADSLIGTGVTLQILRPGFVHSKMTAGMKAAPFATTPEAVAKDVVKALGSTKRVITSPPILEWVFLALRHLPAALWRKLEA